MQLPVIGRQVFVFDDVQVLQHKPLRIVVGTHGVDQSAGRNQTALGDIALAHDPLPGVGRHLVGIAFEVALDAVHFYDLGNVPRD